MVIIIDDFVSNFDTFRKNTLQIIGDKNLSIDWCSFEYEHEFKDFCLQMIDIASKYYDLSSSIGYEFWTHNNTRPFGDSQKDGWHYDKDEFLFDANGTYDYPLCSIVYYPVVQDLEGGQLHLECDIITPQENRLVIFPPKTYHYVQPFKGNRISLLVNPWSKILKHL